MLGKSWSVLHSLCLFNEMPNQVHVSVVIQSLSIFLVAEINGATFWRTPFVSLCSPKQLTEYMVMDVDLIKERDKPRVMGQVSNKVGVRKSVILISNNKELPSACPSTQYKKHHYLILRILGSMFDRFEPSNL